MFDTSHILLDLPYLVAMTIFAILLIVSILLMVRQSNQLKETLREIILLHKDQVLPNRLQKAIYRQLHLPLKYRESQAIDNHWQMIEMLETKEIASLEGLRLRLLFAPLSYVLRLAFHRIIKR